MMYKAYEVDYTERAFLLGTFDTLKEAQAAERKALKKSHGEFPTFTTGIASGRRTQITHNGKIIK